MSADGCDPIAVRTGGRKDRAADERDGLARLYDLYGAALFRMAYATMGRREDAEDAVQEVFVRLARDERRGRHVRDVQRYLFRAVCNACRNIARYGSRQGVFLEALRSDAMSRVETGNGDAYDLPEVIGAFAQLPPDQRQVVVLRVLEQMTFAEIADALRISPNTAATRFRRAMARMRKALEDDDGRR